MIKSRKNKVFYIVLFLCGLSLAVGLVLFALKQNINLFYTPQELVAAKLTKNTRVRLGGLVRNGSIIHAPNLSINFIITDHVHDIKVVYQGVLPDLFREGQGVVALGSLGDNNIFYAEQILAKHDENYMPPELANINKNGK